MRCGIICLALRRSAIKEAGVIKPLSRMCTYIHVYTWIYTHWKNLSHVHVHCHALVSWTICIFPCTCVNWAGEGKLRLAKLARVWISKECSAREYWPQECTLDLMSVGMRHVQHAGSRKRHGYADAYTRARILLSTAQVSRLLYLSS